MRDQLVFVSTQFPMDPVIMLGDWNMEVACLQRRCTEWPKNFGIKPRRGNIATHRRGRTLDHIVISDHRSHVGPQATVHVEWDLSDHYPVSCRVPLEIQPAPAREASWQIPRKRIRVPRTANPTNVRTSNLWTPLVEDIESSDCDESAQSQLCNRLADKFIETTHAIATAQDMYTTTDVDRPRGVKLRIKKAIDKRWRLAAQCSRTFDETARAAEWKQAH